MGLALLAFFVFLVGIILFCISLGWLAYMIAGKRTSRRLADWHNDE